MKKQNTFIVIICLLLSVLLLACSCERAPANNADSTDTDGTETPTIGSEDPPDDPDNTIKVIENGKLLYRVVRAKHATETELEAVEKFVKAFNEAGVRPDLYDDSDYNADTLEIVIGTSVDYPEVKSVQANLKYNDYTLTVVGKKIVITAGNEDALASCASYFIKKIISGTESINGKVELSLSPYTYEARYPLEALKISGVPIGNWTIVYPANSDFSYDWAVEQWQKRLGEKTGCYLNVTDSSAEGVEHAIRLGAEGDADVMQYSIAVTSDALTVKSGGVYSAGMAAQGLIKQISDNKLDIGFSHHGNLMNGNLMEPSSSSDLRVMSANILADLESWGGSPLDWRVEILVANIKFYQPDVVGLQETTSTWVKALNHYFADGSYRIISNFTDKGKENYSCILYNTKTLTLKENGCKTYTELDNAKCRHMGWGIFTEKDSGKDFAFISTHWNLGKNMVYSQGEDLWAFMQELSANGTRSVFSVGDYNTGEYGAYYGHLMEISTLKNMKRITTNLVNNIGTEKGLGIKANSATPTIDFILGTEDTACQMFMTMTWNCMEDMSDHSALLADVSIK